jgi:hypothetical protein
VSAAEAKILAPTGLHGKQVERRRTHQWATSMGLRRPITSEIGPITSG